jgi:hypothetical protein
MFGAIGFEEGVKGSWVFAGEDDVAAGESVGCAILTDDGFAFGSAGSGTEFRVPGVGFELGLGRHNVFSFPLE